MPINEDIARELLAKINAIEKAVIPSVPDFDFIEVSRRHIQQLRDEGRTNTAGAYSRSLNSFCTFLNSTRIAICDIKSDIISAYFEHIRKTISLDCAKAYCVDIRVLYNHALRAYDAAPNPFKRLNLRRSLRRFSRSLTVSDIQKMFNAHDLPEAADFARRCFLLSFCLCGINICDLYTMQPPKNNILHYYRQKTTNRRDDKAEQYIKITATAAELAAPMLDKTGKYWLNWHNYNRQEKNLLKRINKGLKDLSKCLNINVRLSTYYARHTFATIARNDLKYDIFDVAECLNHTPPSNAIDFVYIKPDPMKASRIAAAVVAYALGVADGCAAPTVAAAV